MRAFLVIHVFDKMPDAVSRLGYILIGIEVNFFFLERTERIAQLEQLVGRLTLELDIHKKAKALLREKADLNAQGGKGSPE